jgi:DNA-binding Lrp family transcriptional regulator
MEDNTPNIIFLGFADNKVPEFKEVKSKDWIYFGEDNLFPYQLLYLFDKSSNHNAIINGKVTYILGKGLPVNPLVNPNETANKVYRKAVTDMELFGGFYLQCVWQIGGKANWTHMPFQHIRKAKDQDGYWYSKNWGKIYNKDNKPVYIPAFDPEKKAGAQLFCYKEYRPGCDVYPLPGYFGALNDIETDVEISIYNLSIMKNGQFSGKLISFFNGEPTKEQKQELEKQWNKKFNGSGNAGKTMLAFNAGTATPPAVTDLSTTDLDKLFEQLNKTVQAEIFSGHQVTSPMLFGIMEPGKLGGRSELQDAYEIFKNTYINDKQMSLEEVINFLAPFMGYPAGQKLQPVEPIGVLLDAKDFISILPKKWVLEKLGIDVDEYAPELANTSGIVPITPQGMVNDNIKNLTGKQNQNLLRIIRQYGQGKITREMATIQLQSGYGLSALEIERFLGVGQFSKDEQEVAEMFEEYGEARQNFAIVKTKPFRFETEEQMFKDIKGNDSAILDLIKKDKRITPEVIAETIGEKVAYVKGRITSLTEAGVLRQTTNKIGIDAIIEHTINPEQIDRRTPPETADIFIRYSYEVKPGVGPELLPGNRSRAFCRKLIELDRLYTRAEIESISQRVGFSVWDRKGGFWNDGGDILPECRHRWVANIIVKKKAI